MKIIILEGIATSGKTSVRKELEKLLDHRELKHSFVDENETLMPILKNTDPLIAANFVHNVLTKYISLPVDVLIFDRLYLTHLWRTKGSPDEFDTVSKILLQHNALICFLKIPSERISARIEAAMTHRDEKWNEYVKVKAGATVEEREGYYLQQQNELLELLRIIPVPHQVFETGEMNFPEVAMLIDENI